VYQQLKLDAQSQNFVVINTHKGLFHFTWLPFGISSAPGIFQKIMETLLRGIPGVSVFIGNILISYETQAEHLESLEEVLMRLTSVGLRVKQSKCKFLIPLIEFLGHLIDSVGPTKWTELRSYIGLPLYCGKFLPHLSTSGSGHQSRKLHSISQSSFSYPHLCSSTTILTCHDFSL